MKNNNLQFKIIFLAIIFIGVFGWVGSSKAEVIFEDNFNGFTSGWTPSISDNLMHVYPCVGGQCGDPGNYEPSVYPPAERNNSNSWNGWTKDPNADISISTNVGRNNSPALQIRFNQVNGWIQDASLIKWLGASRYQEVYIRYYFKYADNWKFNHVPFDPTGLWKQLRVWGGVCLDNMADPNKTAPRENTLLSDESNWIGQVVPRIIYPDWRPNGNPFFSVQSFYFPTDCGTPLSCDSQSCPLGGDQYCNTDSWEYSPSGWITTYANSGNPLNSDGNFTQAQGWHSIEYHVKFRSSPSASDGLLEIWIDGTKLIDPTTTQSFKPALSEDPDDYGITLIFFNGNSNGLTRYLQPGTFQSYYVDDVVISTTYIGPDYVIGADITPPAAPRGLSVS